MRAARRKFLLITACVVVAAFFSASGLHWWLNYSGGPGSSIETAIVITAPEKEYVSQKYAWLAKLYPDVSISDREQYLVEFRGRLYDIESFQTPKGERKVYFDITAVK